MTRFRIGALLLLLLLGLSLWAQSSSAAVNLPIAQRIRTAGSCALAGDWSGAEENAAAAVRRWQEHWTATALLADHSPMEDIDCLLAQLPAAAEGRDAGEYAALCFDIARRVSAVAQAQQLTLSSFL